MSLKVPDYLSKLVDYWYAGKCGSCAKARLFAEQLESLKQNMRFCINCLSYLIQTSDLYQASGCARRTLRFPCDSTCDSKSLWGGGS